MSSGSGISEMSEDVVEAAWGHLGLAQTAKTHAGVGQPRVVTSLIQQCDTETQLCPLYLTIETPCGS